jgi:S-DNA-T family DNA segregation ATPase FtsK/SpoIIIE
LRFAVTLRDGRAAGTQTEALLDAHPDSELGALLPHLLEALDDETDPAQATQVPVWVDGRRVDPADRATTLRSAGIRPGSIVELHSHEENPSPQPTGVAEVRVVNGPGAGRVHRLGLGQTVIGHEAAGLDLPDTELAADALTLSARPGGRVDVIPGPGTSFRLDEQEQTERCPWPPGVYLHASETVLELAPVSEPDADAQPSDNGLGLELYRHTRSARPRSGARFVLPARPPSGRSIPGREQRRLLNTWLRERERASAEIAGALKKETKERREATPDPALTLLTAVGPGRRLWERLPLDDDWLQLRLGLAPQPPRTVIDDRDSGSVLRVGRSRLRTQPPEPLPTLLDDVPVTLNLQAVGVLGIAGKPSVAHATARWLVAQCATFHAPRELRITVLTGHDYAARRRWEWVSRLPHARPDEASGVSVLIGNDHDSIERRLLELGSLIDERLRQRLPPGQRVTASPEVVVVFDGIRRLSGIPGVLPLLEEGQNAGVHSICVEEEEQSLPEICRAVVSCASESSIAFRRTESTVLGGIRPDLTEAAWADRLSRSLAAVRMATVHRHPDETPLADPHAWAISWDDVGYPAPSRPRVS